MKPIIRVFLFTLGLPILAAGLSMACLSRIDSDLRESVRKQYPKTTAEQIAGLTVASLAQSGGFKPGAELPVIYANLGLARNTAIAAGLLGLGLMGGITAAGRATLRRRDLLLRLFRPGLFVTLLLVGVLTAAQALAVAYALYYFESIYIGTVHYILIIGVGVGGVLALVAVIRAMLSLRHASEMEVLGRSVSRQEQERLWGVVDGVCAELNARPPDNLVLGLEPTFYVTESAMRTGDETLRGRTLFLSLSLSRLLTLDELRAVIGHEMAHFIGDDTVFSQQFFPVYRGTFTALSHLSRNSVHSTIAIAQLPAIAFLGFFYNAFAASEKNLSRTRETEADAVGARIGGARALATALVKVHSYTGGWKKILEAVRFNEELVRTQPNLALPMRSLAAAVSAEELAQAGENHVFHPTDSHPSLALRLESLQVRLEEAVPQTAVPAPGDSAAALIEGPETLEVEQSERLRKLVRPTGD